MFWCLDFSEILIGFTVLSTGDVRERLKFLFRVYDQNNDGFIDLEELRTALKVICVYYNWCLARNLRHTVV